METNGYFPQRSAIKRSLTRPSRGDEFQIPQSTISASLDQGNPVFNPFVQQQASISSFSNRQGSEKDELVSMTTPTWNRKPSMGMDQISNFMRRPSNQDLSRLTQRSESMRGLELLDKVEVDFQINRLPS